METAMVTGLMEKVAVQDFHPYTEREAPETRVGKGSGRGDSLAGASPVEDPTVAGAAFPKADPEAVPVEVVSKDFILGLLSLAIGKPLVLEGNLGTNVDVKI
jgi:hypothetical protein